MGWLETKSKDCSIVLVTIILNVILTFLLIICVAHQQREITNLRETLSEHMNKESNNFEQRLVKHFEDGKEIKPEVIMIKVRLSIIYCIRMSWPLP